MVWVRVIDVRWSLVNLSKRDKGDCGHSRADDPKFACGAIPERDPTNRETLRERYSNVGKPAPGVVLLHSCCCTWVTPYMFEHSCSSKKHSYIAHSKSQIITWNPNERISYCSKIPKNIT